MKRILFIALLLWAGLAKATDNYTLDPMHTYVEWHISHFGFSEPEGKWMIKSGTLTLDKDHPQNCKVEVTIQMDALDTGLTELDKHLKSSLFFNVPKYPLATYVSNKIILTSKTTARVDGILTLRGVSKPVVLKVKLNKSGVNPVSDKETAGFDATTTLKRSDFGMNAYLPGLGDEVQINISAEANRAN
jgi:polyisoprenoid-binding protein YceI